MTRSVPEWIGKTDNTKIPARVRLRVFDGQSGRCASCGRKMGVAGERWDVDHTVALVNGGKNREGNLRGLCGLCHVEKTKEDVAEKATVARKRKAYLGIKKPKRPIPGSKGSGLRRKMDGTVVRVDE